MIDWANLATARPRQSPLHSARRKDSAHSQEACFGAGKSMDPAAKSIPARPPLSAALRETQEELGITPLGAEQRGRIALSVPRWLQPALRGFSRPMISTGEPHETAEARPALDPRYDQIPYEEMWADDRHWLPLLIAGAHFEGYFEFDGEKAPRTTKSALGKHRGLRR
jgi:8-oxo-dGTP diphosphatase